MPTIFGENLLMEKKQTRRFETGKRRGWVPDALLKYKLVRDESQVWSTNAVDWIENHINIMLIKFGLDDYHRWYLMLSQFVSAFDDRVCAGKKFINRFRSIKKKEFVQFEKKKKKILDNVALCWVQSCLESFENKRKVKLLYRALLVVFVRLHLENDICMCVWQCDIS